MEKGPWVPQLLRGNGMDLAGFFTKMRRKADKKDMEMKGKKNLRSNQQGFTFPEMLIVLILITIISAISYGAFRRMGVNSDLRTAARDIASDFQLARQRAMAENTNLTITFNPGNHTYTVPQPGGGILTKTMASYGGAITINSITIPGAAVVFQPRGTTTSPPGDIILINSRASTATINIIATGRANVTFEMH
jgi:prepilin-type N-terminal cleavage/methylation domain-containing protein